MPQIKSSNIASVDWAEGVGLTVVFRRGGEYVYPAVDETTFNDLLASASPGAYFAQHVKDRYDFRKVG